MKKRFVIMASIMMFYTMGFCQNPEKSVSNNDQTSVKSEITWVNSETIDLGKIEKGVPKTVTFEFQNSGNAPLIISSAKGQCGCTKVEYSKEPIQANAKGFVKVTYNAANQGTFNKSIVVYANSSEKQIQLNIKGEVY